MRIASLSPAATEILFALGVGKDIVCTDQFSNFPDEAKALPHLKDMVRIDPDALRPFNAEAVFLGTSVQRTLSELLRSQGFPVIFDDPRTLEQIYGWMRSIGTIVGKEKEAKELVVKMRSGFSEVEKKAKAMRTGRDVRFARLYIEEWPALPGKLGEQDPPYASGNWVPEIATIAGCSQFPIPPGELSRAVALEEVERWDPSLIVISWCGAGALADKALLMKRPGWDRLRAVQKGHVRVIDDSLLNRPGPRLVEGAQRLYGWMFEVMH